jgi:hypothetical protein
MCDGTGLRNGASLPPFAHWWSPELRAIPIFQTVSEETFSEVVRLRERNRRPSSIKHGTNIAPTDYSYAHLNPGNISHVRRLDEAGAEMSTKTSVVGVVVSVLVILGMLKWFFSGGPMVLNPGEPLVRNGVAVIVACGDKRGAFEAMNSVPNPQMGSWSSVPRGTCVAYYHHPSSTD